MDLLFQIAILAVVILTPSLALSGKTGRGSLASKSSNDNGSSLQDTVTTAIESLTSASSQVRMDEAVQSCPADPTHPNNRKNNEFEKCVLSHSPGASEADLSVNIENDWVIWKELDISGEPSLNPQAFCYTYEDPSVAGSILRDIGPDQLSQGCYTYLITKDGHVSYGKVENGIEWGVKHAHLAKGQPVVIAGELCKKDHGEIKINILSGTFTSELQEKLVQIRREAKLSAANSYDEAQSNLSPEEEDEIEDEVHEMLGHCIKEEFQRRSPGKEISLTSEKLLPGDTPNSIEILSRLCITESFTRYNQGICDTLFKFKTHTEITHHELMGKFLQTGVNKTVYRNGNRAIAIPKRLSSFLDFVDSKYRYELQFTVTPAQIARLRETKNEVIKSFIKEFNDSRSFLEDSFRQELESCELISKKLQNISFDVKNIPVMPCVKSSQQLKGINGFSIDSIESDLIGIDMERSKPNLQKLTLREKIDLFGKISAGVKLLHDHGLVHGDLKPENILVWQNEGHLQSKIIDLGALTDLSSPISEQPREYTLDYLAPEVGIDRYGNSVSEQRENEKKKDIFALGMTFLDIQDEESAKKLKERLVKFRDSSKPFKQSYSYLKGAIERYCALSSGQTTATLPKLICSMLQVLPKDRMSIDAVVDYLKQIQREGGNEGVSRSAARSPAQNR